MPVPTRPASRTEAQERNLGLVLVGTLDRRLLPALRLAASLVDHDIKAVHISVDDAETKNLAEQWMRLDLGWAPLQIEEVEGRPFLAVVEDVVERETKTRKGVVVIVPEIDLDRWWQSLLHRGMGRRIARRLRSLPKVSTIVVPYAAT